MTTVAAAIVGQQQTQQSREELQRQARSAFIYAVKRRTDLSLRRKHVEVSFAREERKVPIFVCQGKVRGNGQIVVGNVYVYAEDELVVEIENIQPPLSNGFHPWVKVDPAQLQE
mgnify:CR=1 FL=1